MSPSEDLPTVQRPHALRHLYAAYALAAFGQMGESETVTGARKLLRWLAGRPEPTAELMLSYISGGGVVPTREVVKLICAERCVQLNKRATIPLEFMGVEENTALVGPFSRQVLSAAEWFGNVAL